MINTENKNNNSLDHSAKPQEDVAKIGVMGAVVQNDALKQGRCSTPSNACTEQNARYEAAFKARAEGDAIKPFTLVEEVAASIVTGNFVFRGLKWGIGTIFAGRTTELALPESYWINNKSTSKLNFYTDEQITPGIRSVDSIKASSIGGTYRQTTHYDEFGRRIGRTDRSNHGRSDPLSKDFHPDPHHHRELPATINHTRQDLVNPATGSKVWPGWFGN